MIRFSRSRLTRTIFLFLLFPLLAACGGPAPAPPDTTPAATTPAEPETTPKPEIPDIPLYFGAENAALFSIVYQDELSYITARIADGLQQAARDLWGAELPVYSDKEAPPGQYEILIGQTNRPASQALFAALGERHFAVTVSETDGGGTAVALGAHVSTDFVHALHYLEGVMCTAAVTADSGTVRRPVSIRDPNIVYHEGMYYMYGTGYSCYKSRDLVSFEWVPNFVDYSSIPDAASYESCYWAPECHAYKGQFYLFATYRSETTGYRGCGIFRADHPAGPFVMISDGQVTPSTWDAIDGTLYVDGNGRPWMVFVQEWTATEDGLGRMSCVRLTKDLTASVGEPIHLFSVRDAAWPTSQVTDGPWMYQSADGALHMLWSSHTTLGYAVGVATSASGDVRGPWVQEETPLFARLLPREARASGRLTSIYLIEGGHSSLFYDADGRLFMSFHAPNASAEAPFFVEMYEQDNRLAIRTYSPFPAAGKAE